MNTLRFTPEGWEDKLSVIKKMETSDIIQKGEILQGVVEECDEQYNLHVKLGNGMMGIVPRNEVEAINLDEDGLPKTNLCTGKVHKYIQFKVKSVEDNGEIFFSRKDVQQDALEWVKNELEEGQKLTGIVKNIRPYGAFIEIGGGVVGLAHIEDLSIARIKSPFERLKIGQKVNIVVKSINMEDGKVTLSYKENFGTWEENVKNFAQGTKVKGIVRETEKNKNGIFIELAPNLVGMAEYKEGLQYGQNVNVHIKKIDMIKRKIKLLVVSDS